MKHGNSHLGLGVILGAVAGACATYLIIKNRHYLESEFEMLSEKIKRNVNNMTHKARAKAEEYGDKFEEKVKDAADDIQAEKYSSNKY